MEDPQVQTSDDMNTRLLAALDQELGRRVRLGLEQHAIIESLQAENRQLREVGQRLLEQHAPGHCQPVTEEPAAEPAPPTPLHPDCPECAAEAGG